MFTNPLPDDEAYLVHIAPYAQQHFIKRFAKDYPGKRWKVTLDSIREDLKRVRALAHTYLPSLSCMAKVTCQKTEGRPNTSIRS
jgi:hypothetical protein